MYVKCFVEHKKISIYNLIIYAKLVACDYFSINYYILKFHFLVFRKLFYGIVSYTHIYNTFILYIAFFRYIHFHIVTTNYLKNEVPSFLIKYILFFLEAPKCMLKTPTYMFKASTCMFIYMPRRHVPCIFTNLVIIICSGFLC